MRIEIIVFLFLVSRMSFFSQNQEAEYNTISISPSPNASAVLKCTEFPVKTSIRIPSISNPIIYKSQQTISLLITMSHKGGGINVELSSFWIRLVWLLNAGEVITRLVMGFSDDKVIKVNYGFLSNSDNVQSELIVETTLNVQSLRDSVYFQPEHIECYHLGKYSLPNRT